MSTKPEANEEEQRKNMREDAEEVKSFRTMTRKDEGGHGVLKKIKKIKKIFYFSFHI